MVVTAEYRVIMHIAQEIIHPAHVPFEIKTKAVMLQRSGHLGPCGGFLSDQKRSIFSLLVDGIQVLQELNRLQVLLSAILIRDPFALIFSIVQVQHRCHRVHADAVGVVFFRPEQGIGNQEVFHLRTSIVVKERSPVRMLALPRVKMLVEAGAVEARQSKGVLGEMGRNPVQDHADTLLMHIVHEIHEVLRRTVARRGRIIPGHLITPGLIQRMLHDRHYLHMRVTHLFHIRSKHRGQFPVGIEFPRVLRIRIRLPPASQMHLIDQQGLFPVICRFPLLQPFLIGPGKAGQIGNHRSRVGPQLRRVGVRIGLQHRQSLLRLDLVFIAGPCFQTRDKQLVDARLSDLNHRIAAAVPHIKVAHHTDTLRVRRPDCKISALHTVDGHGVRAHFLIDCVMDSFSKCFQICFCKYLRREPVDIFQLLHHIVVVCNPEMIGRNLSARNQRGEEALIVRLFHFHGLSRILQNYFHPDCCRQKGLNQGAALHLMGT